MMDDAPFIETAALSLCAVLLAALSVFAIGWLLAFGARAAGMCA